MPTDPATLTHIAKISVDELQAAFNRLAVERRGAGETRRVVIGRIIDRVLEEYQERLADVSSSPR